MSKLLSILVGTVIAIGAVSMQGKEMDRITMDIPVAYAEEMEVTEAKTETAEAETEKETLEETVAEPVDETVEETEAVTIKVEDSTGKIYFDVPLSHEIQDHIFNVCEEYDIPPYLVVAIIERESSFRIKVRGDAGASYGLMQVKEDCHFDRMKRLNCTDLLDPYQCILVGVDYLAELCSESDDIHWVLMAYKGGRGYANPRYARGEIIDYALEIPVRALEFKEMIE